MMALSSRASLEHHNTKSSPLLEIRLELRAIEQGILLGIEELEGMLR
jgi:hypothetical protein